MKFSHANFWHRVVKRADGCWGWTGFVDNKGYGRVNVHTAGVRRSQGAHRASWFIHYGDIPEGMHILHSCDNPQCTNPEHLRLGTHAENMRDMKERGRAKGYGKPGEACGHAKLTWEKVREIRRLKDGCPTLSNHVLAVQFGVTPSNISNIVTGKTWREVSPDNVVSMEARR